MRYDPEHKPGVANLMNIYAAVTGKTFEEILTWYYTGTEVALLWE